MASPQESNSVCLKRKLVDDHISKEFKSRRVEARNELSECCNHCHGYPNFANDCINFLKSDVPSHIMYYENGSWHNFPEQIMKSLIEEFRGKKTSAVVVLDNEPLLVDFLSMTLINLKTRKQRSVAWFDDTDKWFFPSVFFEEEAGDVVRGDAVNVQSTVQSVLVKVTSSPPEVVKQVVLQSCPLDSQKSCNTDMLRKKMAYVKRGSEDFQFVQDLFLSGMGPFATPQNLLHVYRHSQNDIAGQCRLKYCERRMRFTKERGNADIRYGWLGCRKNDIVRILISGLDAPGKPVEKSGVYLSPKNQAFTSVALCDDDEKGVQYMLLCRVILDKREAVELGSQESFPRNKMCDSGVDCLNPSYVMSPSDLRTHVRFEYLISFKLAPIFRSYLLGVKGLWLHQSPKQVGMGLSLKPVMSETGHGPTTPWISLKVLFGVIHEKVSPVARGLLFHHYEELKQSKITRQEMVKKMMTMVGAKILLESLNKLQQCPSLWYKSSVEVDSKPARKETKQLHLDMGGRNCLIAPCGTHGDDSRASNATGCGNSPLISTDSCDSPSSSKESKCREPSMPNRMPQRYQHQAQDAAMEVHSAPKPRRELGS